MCDADVDFIGFVGTIYVYIFSKFGSGVSELVILCVYKHLLIL